MEGVCLCLEGILRKVKLLWVADASARLCTTTIVCQPLSRRILAPELHGSRYDWDGTCFLLRGVKCTLQLRRLSVYLP